MQLTFRRLIAVVSVLVLAAACILSSAARAATTDVGPPDRWLTWENNFTAAAGSLRDCDIAPALAAQWDQNLQVLARRLVQTAVVWPEGWVGSLSGFYGRGDGVGPSCKGVPVAGYVTYSLWAPGKLKLEPGQTRLKRPLLGGEGDGPRESVYFHVNQLQGIRTLDWVKDSEGPRLGTGQQTGTLYGYPVWEDKWLLITAPNHPAPFVPATLERVVKLWVADQNKQLKPMLDGIKAAEAAKQKPLVDMYIKMADGTRKNIERVTKLLDGPPEKRQGPAYVGGSGGVQAEPGGGAQQVWAENPAYFDPKQPRTALQVVAIDVTYWGLDKPAAAQADGKGIVRQLFDRTDWAALAKDILK